MSKTNKRKHVLKEIYMDEFELPKEDQSIVKVLRSKGNNLHEVVSPSGDSFLVSMPTKFRKNIWVKRGDFVLVEPILEGDKVKAEIVRIMNKDSIKFFKENNVWPPEFEDNRKQEAVVDENNLFVNTNRINVNTYVSDDSDSDSDNTDDSEDNT